jgi:hypothetical protein
LIYSNTIAIIKKKSPILLINIALNADLFAWILVFQKLINKNEHKPTPSHPKNKTKKFEDETSININIVNKVK